MMTWISCAVTALAGYSAGEISPSSAELTKEWGISQVVYNLGITLFCVGFALAPMVLAPFSEINGRRPIFIASGIVFVGMVFLRNEWQRFSMLISAFTACIIACGGTHSFGGMLVARFFQGAGGCMSILAPEHFCYRGLLTTIATFSTMVGGVISDIYHAEDRNTPMALFSGAALFGTGLAPMLAGAVVQHTTWRWVWYSHAIVSAVFVVIIFLFFKETRGSVLLSRKAKALNTYYDQLESAGHYGVIMSDKEKVRRIRWKVKSDEERASLAQMISISCYRPFRELSSIYYPSNAILTREQDLLVTEPTVFFFSLWVSFSWAVLYLQFGSIPLVFKTNHGFNVEQSGAVFACMSPTIPDIGLADNFQPCVWVSSS
jgi:MFS family permease